MKKYIFYILIIITLVGLSSPMLKIAAQEGAPPMQYDELNPNGTIGGSMAPSSPTAPAVVPKTVTPTQTPTTVTPTTTSTDKTYHLLAPLPGVGDTFDPGTKVGDNGALGKYLNAMIRIFIGICAVLAVIMIVIGGIEYMTAELISNKEEGKKRITGAIFGLLLALGAWTLLYQINPNLLNADLKSLTNVTVTVTINDNVAQTPINGKYTNSNLSYAVGENWVTRAGPAKSKEELAAYGASVYNSECTTVGQTNCTSTAGLSLSYLNTIHQKCPSCTLSIQGGTEFWAHGGSTGSTSHGVGSPTVDLGVNDALNKYILSGTPQGNGRYLKDGISYLDERSSASHWHAGP